MAQFFMARRRLARIAIVPNQPAGDEIAQGCGAGAEQRERHRRGQDLPNRSRRWVGPMQWSERLEQGGKPTDAAARRRRHTPPLARRSMCADRSLPDKATELASPIPPPRRALIGWL
jgi:hypothetical protein